MDVYILWGFLGSGKTTLINYLLSTYMADKKVVVVENESGTESVDGVLLRSRDYLVKDLVSGCICCTLRMELPRVIEDIRHSIHPEIVLIEPSGLASLEELMQIPGFKPDGIVTLIDAPMYAFLQKLNPDFYRRQFRLSSVILLTKTEQVDVPMINRIVDELLTIKPRLRIIPDYRELCREDWKIVWQEGRNYGLNACLPVYSKVSGPEYKTWTLHVHSPLDIYFCEALFNRVNKKYPNGIIRAKGIVRDLKGQWEKVDYVHGRMSSELLSPSCEMENSGFISVWWDKQEEGFPREWISSYLSASEVPCSVDYLLVDDQELYRSLGFKDSVPDVYMLDFIQRLKQEALSICVPRFGYRFVSGERTDRHSLVVGGQTFVPEAIIVSCLRNSDFFAAIVASVGKELDEWIEKKRSGEDVMEAFIADALGSVIVESIVTWGLAFIENQMKDWNLGTSNSYSPGYCGWNVVEQRLFFSLLPDKFCGISLTDSCLMLPIKSVSALVGIGKDVEKRPYGCAICKKKDCFKRKEVGY